MWGDTGSGGAWVQRGHELRVGTRAQRGDRGSEQTRAQRDTDSQGTRSQMGHGLRGTQPWGRCPWCWSGFASTRPGHGRGSGWPLALGTSADKDPGLSPRCPTGCPHATAHEDVSSRSGLLRLPAPQTPPSSPSPASCPIPWLGGTALGWALRALQGHEGVKAPGAVLRGRSSVPSLCTSGCNKGRGGRSIPEH